MYTLTFATTYHYHEGIMKNGPCTAISLLLKISLENLHYIHMLEIVLCPCNQALMENRFNQDSLWQLI